MGDLEEVPTLISTLVKVTIRNIALKSIHQADDYFNAICPTYQGLIEGKYPYTWEVYYDKKVWVRPRSDCGNN